MNFKDICLFMTLIIFVTMATVTMATEREAKPRYKREFPYKCPQQTDFSATFRLSSNGANYPETAIDNELKNRVDGIDTCLASQTVPANASKVPEDPMLDNFTRDICPAGTQMLRSYFNTLINSTCWIILNVQEMITFASCRNLRCQNCDFRSYNLQNRCYLKFDVMSVWSFCDELPVLFQIFRDRIIVPSACVCRQVECKRNYRHYW